MIIKLEPSIFREERETRNLIIRDQQFDQTYILHILLYILKSPSDFK